MGLRIDSAGSLVDTLLLTLAAVLVAADTVIGSHVDANGWLHEPFALIPLAWLVGLTGAALIAVAFWRRRRDRS